MKNTVTKLITCLILFITSISAKSQIVYVDPNASGTGNGASWANAMTDLQTAIDAAAGVATSIDPIQVWVKAGIYKATSGTDQTIRFEVKNYVEMYGGFAGTESDVSDRNIGNNPTIISGDIGVLNDRTDNSQGLLIVDAAVNGPVVLDGFVFDGAYDPGNNSTIGIISLETGASPTEYNFTNCTFSNNDVTFGSVLGFTSIPGKFYSCRFIENFQVTFWSIGNLEIYNSLFEANSFPVYVQSGTFTSVNNTYYNNTGIAVNLFDQPTPVTSFFYNNIFWQNSAEDISANGNASSNLTAVNNLIQDPFTLGINTISLDPQFLDPANDDFRISHCSPAVDQGDNSQISLLEDLTGNPRIFNATVDLGAFENQVSPIFFSAAEIGDVNCNGGSDGQISVNAGGGTGAPIMYSVDGINFSANSVFPGLSAGDYSIYATDGVCVYSELFTVNEPDVIEIDASVSQGTTSYDLTISASGGVGLYEYSIDGTNFQNSGSFSVSDGQFTIYVRDANNCTITESVSISPEGRLILFLDPDATGSSSGTSWVNAFTDLQTAIDQAGIAAGVNNAVEVWVKSGTYYPPTAQDPTVTINMRNNVYLMGGFAGTETTFSQRDVRNNQTILSGDIGVAADSTDNSYGMLTVGSDVSNEAMIDGWTLEGAFSLAVEPTNGAIHITGTAGDFYIRNCTFRNNLSNQGACIRTTDLTNTTSKLSVESSAFFGNGFFTNTGYIGSAIYAKYNVEIYNAVFVDNKSGNGGAFYLASTSTVDIINSTFYDNRAGTGSVLVGLGGASLSLYNSILWNNPATNNQQLTIGQSTISNNIIEGFNLGNNINQDPEFVDLTSLDLAIKHCSPGIDAGVDTFLPMNNTIDFGGDPRIFGSSVDIGAFESQNAPIAISLISKSDVNCNGLSDGQLEVNATGGSGATLEYSLDGTSFSTTSTFSGLAAGNYTVTVSDPGNGCQVTENYSIVEPNAISISAVSTDISCTGLIDGTITGTITEGTAPYQVFLDGTLVQSGITSGFVINDLPSDSYTLSVTDDNGCSLVFSSSLDIVEPVALTASATTTDVLCNGDSNGSISITASGGTEPYEYSIDGTNFQVSNQFAGLVASNHTLTIRDANNCLLILNEVVNEPSALTIQPAVVTDASCNGQNDGAISVLAAGGISPYEFSLDGGVFGASSEFSNLVAGNYSVTARDANGCEAILNETLANSINIVLSAQTINPLCHGESSGEIILNPSGGEFPFEYFINSSSSPQTSSTFSGLSAGSYQFLAIDNSGCEAMLTVELENPAELALQSVISNASCKGAADGTIEVNATGGISPYSYSIDGSNFQSSGLFDNLLFGNYSIDVVDANNCQITETLSVAEPDILTVTAERNSSGGFLVTGTGGTAPYEYSIDGTNFQNSPTFSALSPGSYSFTIQDANGCIASTENDLVVLSAERNEFAVYPNPATDELLIKGIIYDQIVLTDIGGREVLRTKNSSIDLQGVAKGLHVLRLFKANKEILQKKIVIH